MFVRDCLRHRDRVNDWTDQIVFSSGTRLIAIGSAFVDASGCYRWQKIRALILYRWPRLARWFIEGKQGVVADLQDALAQRHRWRA
jgi:hypothetical protein